MREEALSGGNFNPVVRSGDTVRRATGAWTPAVHRLLNHLEATGFSAAPRVIGIDDQGREVLTYIDGTTDSSGAPAWVWSERALVSSAQLIRRFHDATRAFVPPADALWQALVGAPAGGEVVCHNDLAPYNLVFRDGLPVAIIDWDMAAPGPALWDVAFAAWRFVPLYADLEGRGWPGDIGERAGRLRLLCDTYGLTRAERGRLMSLVERRIQCGYDALEVWGPAGKPGWSQLWQARAHGEGSLRDLAYVRAHRRAFDAALS